MFCFAVEGLQERQTVCSVNNDRENHDKKI
jgi:hypothetical protein